MSRLTCEEIDTHFPDTEEPLYVGDVDRTQRWQRQLLFAHFCCGLSWRDAFTAAHMFGHNSLPLDVMKTVSAQM